MLVSGKGDDLENEVSFESSPFLWFIYATDNTVLKITMTKEIRRQKVLVTQAL